MLSLKTVQHIIGLLMFVLPLVSFKTFTFIAAIYLPFTLIMDIYAWKHRSGRTSSTPFSRWAA